MLWDPLASWPGGSRRVWIALALWVGVMQGPGLVATLKPSRTEWTDFFQDWASARNLFRGLPIYSPHIDSARWHLGVAPARLLIERNAHPPTSVLMVAPFAVLDYPGAVLAWNLMSLLALGASLAIVARELGIRTNAWGLAPAIVFLMLCAPLRIELVQGQLNLALLLMLTLAWSAERNGRPGRAGAWIGAAAAIKLIPAFLLLYFAWRRRWRVVGAGLAAFAALTVLTLVVLGPAAFRDYITIVLPGEAKFRPAWNNASLAGFWGRLFDPAAALGPSWQSAPLVASRALARVLTALSIGLVLAAVVWVARRARSRDEQDLSFAHAEAAMLLISPICWEHYFLFLLLPLAIVWQRLPATDTARTLVLVTVCGLCATPLALSDAVIAGGSRYGVASPLMNLTINAVPFYALLGAFLLGLAESRRNGGASAASSARSNCEAVLTAAGGRPGQPVLRS